MLNVLLLCCGLLQGVVLGADVGCGLSGKVSGGLEGTDRARYSSLLRRVKEVSAEPAGESCGTPLSQFPPFHKLLAGMARAPKLKWGPPIHGEVLQGSPIKQHSFFCHWLVRAVI